MSRKTLIVCVAFPFAMGAHGVVWYDSQGFESPRFAPGALNRQDRWSGSSKGTGTAPLVVEAPDPVLGAQAVRLQVADVSGDGSAMSRSIADPLAAGYDVVTVSFGIYRQAHVQNLWWMWVDGGTPTSGIQWDLSQSTHPFGWTSGAGQAPTVLGQYAALTMQWNFRDNRVRSWYNGRIVDDAIPMPVPPDITQLTTWQISLHHGASTGTGGDIVYIDNFRIDVIPEPVSLTLLAWGSIALLLRRR